MRYKLSLPLRPRALSPSRSTTNPLSIQRAQPTRCVVSLASVTVSMSSTDSELDQMGMTVDQATVDAPLVVAGETKTGAIPFPTSSKRTHSLLRATSSNVSQADESDSEHAASHQVVDTDYDPPRKRTRTSALSSPRRPPVRPIRYMSTPSTSPPSLGLQYAVGTSSGSADASCTTTLTPPSASVIPPDPAPVPVSQPRRKWRPAQLRSQIYVYRTIVYGLKIKYDDGDHAFVDFLDGELAQRLRDYLKALGVSWDVLTVDPFLVSNEQAEEEEEPQGDAEDADAATSGIQFPSMAVDEPELNMHSAEPDLPPLPLHLQPSTSYSVRSYQQLVAALHFSMELRCARQHRPQSKIGAWKAKQLKPRGPSPLSHCIFSES